MDKQEVLQFIANRADRHFYALELLTDLGCDALFTLREQKLLSGYVEVLDVVREFDSSSIIAGVLTYREYQIRNNDDVLRIAPRVSVPREPRHSQTYIELRANIYRDVINYIKGGTHND